MIKTTWPTCVLGESGVASISSGGTPSRARPEYFAGNIRWVKSGDLNDSHLVDTDEKISELGLQQCAAKLLPKNTVLIAMYGATVGKTALLGNEAATNQAVCAIRPNPTVFNSQFLQFLLMDLRPRLLNERYGGAQPNISQTIIRHLKVPRPELNEQEKIASVLRKAQRAIEIEEALIATLHELKKSAMDRLFKRGLRGEPQIETKIGPLPRNWRVDHLVEFAHFQRGYDITKKDQKPGAVPVVSSGGIKSWHDVAAAKGPGVVIGRKGSIGLVHYVEKDYWPHDTTLFATDFRGNIPLFVYYRLSVLNLKRLDSGAANPALNRNFLHEELIGWPDPSEQREIAAILQTLDRNISVHEGKRTNLQELFKTMLHQLFSGEIRVAEIDIDVSEIKS